MESFQDSSQPQTMSEPSAQEDKIAVASAEELEQASRARKKRIGAKRAKYRRLLYIFIGMAAVLFFAIYLIMPEIRFQPLVIDDSLLESVETEDFAISYTPPPSIPSGQNEAVPIVVEGTPVATKGNLRQPEDLPEPKKAVVENEVTPQAAKGLKSADQIAKAWAKSSGKAMKRVTKGESQIVDASSAISFQNILFKLGTDELLDEKSIQQVRYIAEAMKRTNGVNFLVEGHTCDLGDASNNKALSEKRATRIVNELIRLGVSDDRLQRLGFGAENPVVPNNSETNRQKNRRVMVYKQV